MVNCYVWGRAIFASLASFVFGYTIGSINGVQDMIDFRRTIGIALADNTSNTCKLGNGNTSSYAEPEDLEASAHAVLIGTVVSVIFLGALVGPLLAGALSDFVGRKVTMMAGGVLAILGGILPPAAYHLWMVILGRIVSGIGLGIAFMVVPVYIAEIAPSKVRGRLVSTTGVALPAGILLGYFVNLGCAEFSFGWRISLSLQSVFMVIFTLGMIAMPESPRWLVMKNRDKQASEVLTRIYRSEGKSTADVLLEIQEAVRATSSVTFQQELGYFFNWKLMRRLLVGLTLAAFNPSVGINTITFYSVTIFCKIGVAPYITTVVVGLAYFLPSFQTVLFVDKLGRKGMLLLGALGQLFALVGAATLLLAFRVEEKENQAVGYIVVVLICFFVACYASTWGIIPWIVNSELYPSKVKGVAVSLTTSTAFIFTYAAVQTSPIFLTSLGTFGSFYMLGALNLLALLFALLFLPETKGESLERIEELFSKPWLQRVNLLYYLRCGCLWCNSVSCCDHRKEIVQKCETVQPISGKGFELGEKEKEYENELMENPPPDVDTKQRSRV